MEHIIWDLLCGFLFLSTMFSGFILWQFVPTLQSFLFLNNSHCIGTPHFAYPLVCWQTSRLFSTAGFEQRSGGTILAVVWRKGWRWTSVEPRRLVGGCSMQMMPGFGPGGEWTWVVCGTPQGATLVLLHLHSLANLTQCHGFHHLVLLRLPARVSSPDSSLTSLSVSSLTGILNSPAPKLNSGSPIANLLSLHPFIFQLFACPILCVAQVRNLWPLSCTRPISNLSGKPACI